MRQIIERVVIGRDEGRRERISVASGNDSNVLVVRALPDEIAQIREVVAQVDSAETTGLPVRSVKLARADAAVVAGALQDFFRRRADDARRSGRRNISPGVSVVGDRRTGTLVISANDEDFLQVESLIEVFDAPTPGRDLQIKVIPLEHARIADIRSAMEGLVNEIRFPSFGWVDGPPDTMMVEYDQRSNAVVLMGKGESFGLLEGLIAALDKPTPDEGQTVVQAIRLENADARAVGEAIEEAMESADWEWWMGNDPGGVRTEIDRQSGTLFVIGLADSVNRAVEYARQLDSTAARPDREVATIELRFATASRVARSLDRFFDERTGNIRGPKAVSVLGSEDGNILIVSAGERDMLLVRDLVAQIDQPESDEGRQRELYHLKNIDAIELTNTLREQFPRGLAARDEVVIVTPQPQHQLRDRLRTRGTLRTGRYTHRPP